MFTEIENNDHPPPDSPVKVFGHRGSRGTHAENTYPAFLEAIESAAHFIELDVGLSGDNIPVVFHDNDLTGRVCYGSDGERFGKTVPLRMLKARNIAKIHCGRVVNKRFPLQRRDLESHIPLLDETLAWLLKQKTEIGVVLDTKVARDDFFDRSFFASVLVGAVRSHKIEHRAIIQGDDLPLMAEIRKIAGNDIQLSYLFYREKDFPKTIDKLKGNRVALHHWLATKERVQWCVRRNIEVICYSVNHEKEWKSLIQKGVNGIITDYPRKLISYLEGGVPFKSARLL